MNVHHQPSSMAITSFNITPQSDALISSDQVLCGDTDKKFCTKKAFAYRKDESFVEPPL